MTDEVKGAVIGAAATLIVGVAAEIVTISIYNDQKKTLVESTEKATVEKLAAIYENVTENMDYEQAFTVLFEDYERSKEEKAKIENELSAAIAENEKLETYFNENQENIYNEMEKQADEYAEKGDYLRAISVLDMDKVTPTIEILRNDCIRKYEASITTQINTMIKDKKLDEADKLISEGLKYLPDSQVLTDLRQKVENSHPRKMLEAVPAYQWGGNPYKEYKSQNSGGVESFSMGGKKYVDGMTFNPRSESTWSVYNLDGKFNSLDFTVCHVDGTANGDPTVLQIFYNSSLYKEVELSPDMFPQEISLDLSGIQQLKFQVLHTYSYEAVYGIGDPVIN